MNLDIEIFFKGVVNVEVDEDKMRHEFSKAGYDFDMFMEGSEEVDQADLIKIFSNVIGYEWLDDAYELARIQDIEVWES